MKRLFHHLHGTLQHIVRFFVIVGCVSSFVSCGRSETLATYQQTGSATPNAYPAPVTPGVLEEGATPTYIPVERLTPTPTRSAADLTAIAMKQSDLQIEANLRATAQVLPTLTPNSTPFSTVLPQPTEVLHTGLSEDPTVCGNNHRINGFSFAAISCFDKVENSTFTRVIVGGATQDPPPDRHWRGGIVIYTSTLQLQSGSFSPIYWTPVDHGLIRIKYVNGTQIIVQAENGTVFVFDTATRVWQTTAAEPLLTTNGSIASGSLGIEVPGRFRLVFDEAHKWQASAWYDLSHNATENLARSDGPTLNYNVIQSPVELAYDQWYNLDNATSPSMTIIEQDTSHIMLQTSWKWHPADGSTFVVTSTHTIRTTGAWEIKTFLTNQTDAPRTFNALEYAFTNVRPDRVWQEFLAPTSDRFSQLRSDGTTPRPIFVVERGGTRGTLDSDGIGNRYWSVQSVMLEPNATWSVFWTNYLWPGQP